MFDSPTLSVSELAERWQKTPRQILDYAQAPGVPLYFPFEGLVFDVNDEWHRHGGDWQQSYELETLGETILGREAWIKRSAHGKNGEFEPRLTSEECQALRIEIEADKRKRTAVTELLEQRRIERNRCEYRGYLRAGPSTLWDVATTGTALFPHKAFHLDGRMVALEPGPGRDRYKKDTLTADDLCAFLVEVKAIEAHQAAKQQTAPEPQTVPPAPVVAESASNDTTPDPERRLARLRALGGSATYKRGEWKIIGITYLVESEKSEGRKRSDEKTIRADLREAAQNELEAKRAGFGSGLGQR